VIPGISVMVRGNGHESTVKIYFILFVVRQSMSVAAVRFPEIKHKVTIVRHHRIVGEFHIIMCLLKVSNV